MTAKGLRRLSMRKHKADMQGWFDGKHWFRLV